MERTETATLQCAGNRRAGLMASATSPARRRGARARPAPRRGPASRSPTSSRWPGRCAKRRTSASRAPTLPGGQAGRALRWLDPARQGVPSRGPARPGDERRAAAAGARRAAAGGRAGLHRRAQREVARADRGPLDALAGYFQHVAYRLLPEDGMPGPGAGCRSAWSRSTPTCCHRPTARRSRPVRWRCAATPSPAGSDTSPESTSPATPAPPWTQAELLEDLGRWAWRHWRITSRPSTRQPRARRARLGLLGGHAARRRGRPVEPQGLRNNARPRVRVRAVANDEAARPWPTTRS